MKYDTQIYFDWKQMASHFSVEEWDVIERDDGITSSIAEKSLECENAFLPSANK